MYAPHDPGFEQLSRKALACQASLISIPDAGPGTVCCFAMLSRLPPGGRADLARARLQEQCPGTAATPFLAHEPGHHRSWLGEAHPPHSAVLPPRPPLPALLRHGHLCLARSPATIPGRRCAARTLRAHRERHRRSGVLPQAQYGGSQCCQGIAPSRLVVGAVGRLSPEKGFDLLIRAAAQLLGQGFDLELLILGEGEECSASGVTRSRTGPGTANPGCWAIART